MFKVGDILRTEIATETGHVKVVGVNTTPNPFIRDANWDYIIVEYDPKIDSTFGRDARVTSADLKDAICVNLSEILG